MLFRRRRLTNITAQAVGAQVTINCPVRETYHWIELIHEMTLAEIENIRVLINGRVVQEFVSGVELEAINDYYARPKVAGRLRLWFRRPEFENTAFDRMWALGTKDVDTLQVQFTIGATASAGEEVYALAGVDAEPQNLGLITKTRRFPKSFGSSGSQEIDSIVRGPRVFAMHLKKADVDAVTLKLDDSEIIENYSKADLEAEQEAYGRVPQTAGYTHLDFIVEGNVDTMLVTGGLQSMRLLMELGTSGDVVTIVEYADLFNGI